jgi:hypothetical protein
VEKRKSVTGVDGRMGFGTTKKGHCRQKEQQEQKKSKE